MNNSEDRTGILGQIYSRITEIGQAPSDSDELRLRKRLTVFVVLFGALPAELLIGITLFLNGFRVSGIILFAFAAIYLVIVALFEWLPQYFRFNFYVGWIIGFLNSLLFSYMLDKPLGIIGLLWTFLLTVLAAVLDELRNMVYWIACYLSIVGIYLFVPIDLGFIRKLPTTIAFTASVMTLVFVTLMTLTFLIYFINQRILLQERADNLLLNILPKEIAAILKTESRVIADHYEGTSILFVDIVDFTPLSARLSPTEMVELLDEIFSHFDTLVEKYDLEKIKTIGDSYMVAAGVPRPRKDHAQAIARLALDMNSYVREREFGGKKIRFRIGLNSGPVVAGVIGRKKFIYDLWGDSVNVASRMESHGTAGSIQITEATYSLIKDNFICEPRGEIEIKGKGNMKVWHILGENGL